MVRRVAAGSIIRVDRDKVRILSHTTREVLSELTIPEIADELLPALGAGWIVYAGWVNNTRKPVTSFRSTWRSLLRHPTRMISLFTSSMGWNPPAVPPFSNLYYIGESLPAGGGKFWSVASWWVKTGAAAVATVPPVPVNAGDVITGVMTLTGQSGSSFSYDCGFQGMPQTKISVVSGAELVWCTETLEAYNVGQCSDYPYIESTSFISGIAVGKSSVTPDIVWSPVDKVTDCGQHAVVISNANPGGQVDLYYHSAPPPVTCLSRFRDHLDVFKADPSGAVMSTFWDASSGWFNNWFRLDDGNFPDRFTVPTSSEITTLSRFQDHIDLFVTGRDGAIYSTFWDGGGGWFNHWFRLGDTNYWDNFTVEPGSPIAALSRFRDHIDLFVVGRNGAVFSTFWDASSGWFNRWFPLANPNFPDGFTVPPGSAISALTRFQDHIDLFVTGRDGAIYSTFWDGGGGWFNHWFRLGDTNYWDNFTAEPGSPIAALSRFKDHIDLFVVGRDGGIYSTFWDASSGWFNRWFRLGDPNFWDNFTVPPGSAISALTRFQDHIDLFVTGRDGAIYSTFWDASSGWFNHWFRLGDPNFEDGFTVAPGSSISAVSRYRDHIDLFVTGRDTAAYSTFWDVNGGWFGFWFRP